MSPLLLNTGEPACTDFSSLSDTALGAALMSWGSDAPGRGLYIYAVGSHLFGGHTPPDAYVSLAIEELVNLRERANHPECVTDGDVAECRALAQEIETRLPIEDEDNGAEMFDGQPTDYTDEVQR